MKHTGEVKERKINTLCSNCYIGYKKQIFCNGAYIGQLKGKK